jgi:hypothetical protein
MLKKVVAEGRGGRVVIMDSITKVTADDSGSVAVSASHGGASSGEFALDLAPLKMAVFNDAGVGKDDAGIAALEMLQARGVAGATVSHTSARIGDSQDTWDQGVVSHANALARALGVVPGARLREVLSRLVQA